MAITIEAVFQDGTLKPTTPLTLHENQKVTVTIHEPKSAAERTYGMLGWTGDAETVERVALDDEFGILEAP